MPRKGSYLDLWETQGTSKKGCSLSFPQIEVRPPVFAAVLAFALAAAAPASAQTAWVVDWLKEYVSGRHADVAERLRTVASVRQLEADLETISKTWLKREPADQRKRELAAFALEAAFARVDQGTAAGRLVEWGCRQIRRIAKPGDFERRWHLAAFSVLSGAVDPDSLQAHVTHMRHHFPDEPRLPYERAVASELSAADFFTKGKVSASDVAERYTEAAKRYTEATASSDPDIQAEAWLRLGRVEVARGRAEEALPALDEAVKRTQDMVVRYLASLFRGQALERLGRKDEARGAYESALELAPGAHAATMALATLRFRNGERVEADQLVSSLMGRGQPAADPWWWYWPADYRVGASRIQAMREALK